MSDFHEEFDNGAADEESVATDPQDAPEAETGVGADEPELELEEELDGIVTSDEDAAAEPSADEKAAQYLALAQRTQADFENFRKRAARDAALAQVRGVTKLVKDLLPALDNLDRAITHAASEDPLLEGIKLVRSDLQNALTRAGIESFDPAGENFDPNVHEAVAQFPKEGVAPGTVVEVYQQGYRLGENVLRPARVVVAA